MSHVENVLEMCKRKGISVAKLERDLGFANAYIKGLKKGKIPIDRLQAIAEYLNVPVEQLLGEVDVRLDHASVLSDMDAFSRYLKEIGWEVIFNKEPHQEGYYTLRSEQLTVNISIEQYNDFENRIRNDCVDSILTFVTEAFNNGKSVSLLAARPCDHPDAGDSDRPEDDQNKI